MARTIFNRVKRKQPDTALKKVRVGNISLLPIDGSSFWVIALGQSPQYSCATKTDIKFDIKAAILQTTPALMILSDFRNKWLLPYLV
ncbi:MAG: hypothetical protein ACYTXT_38015 [Nostoc sp.]